MKCTPNVRHELASGGVFFMGLEACIGIFSILKILEVANRRILSGELWILS